MKPPKKAAKKAANPSPTKPDGHDLSKDGHDLSSRRVTNDEVIGDVIAARAKLAKVQRELAAVTKDRDELLNEYEDLQKAKYPVKHVSSNIKKTKDDFIRIIANDVHGSVMDMDAVNAFLIDLKKWNPDEIILNGDIIECGGFLATHHTLGFVSQTEYTFQDDIAKGNWFLDEVQKAAPKAVIHFIEGNHECLHPDHEVLTERGWIPIADVTTEDVVATMLPEGTTAWQNPTHVHTFDFSGELVKLESRAADALMTPNHRLPHLGQYKNDLRYRLAETMVGRASADIPSSAKSTNEEFDKYSDDEICLMTWVLTDGHLSSRIGISQSKLDMVERIENLLNRLDIQFSKRTRNREVKPICGVAVVSNLPSVAFDFKVESSRNVVAPMFGIENWAHNERYAKHVPSWVHKLSDRQFNVFLDEVCLADGSNSSTGHNARVIYGTFDFLSEIQAVCVTHGVRASIRPRNRKGVFSYWVLNISPRATTKTDGRNFTRVQYEGKVHCITTPSSNFFTRYKGSVHLTGNCRIEKWIVDQTLRNTRESEFLRKLLGPEVLLKLKERGINYYTRGAHHVKGLPPGWIKLGKVFFTHELGGGKNAASAAVSRTAGNVVFAHTHQESSASLVLPAVGLVKAWNPGCLCQRQPLWRNSNPTNWSHGYAVQFIAKSGEFLHLNIPIWQGSSMIGSLHHRITG